MHIYICVCVCMCAHIYMPQFRFLQVQHYPLELELSSVGHSDMKSLITRYNFTGWTRWLPRSSSWTGGRAKPKNDALKLSIVLLWIEYQMKLFGSFSLAIKLLHFPFLFSADFCMNWKWNPNCYSPLEIAKFKFQQVINLYRLTYLHLQWGVINCSFKYFIVSLVHLHLHASILLDKPIT